MNDQDIQVISDLFDRLLQQPMTKEEATASLIRIGVLDENGDFTPPFRELSGGQQ